MTKKAAAITSKKLSLRKLSPEWIAVTSQLGRGMCFDFEHPSGNGRISLHQHSDYSMDNWQFFNTQAGDIILIDAESVLNMLSSCPPVLREKDINGKKSNKNSLSDNALFDSEWYWQLYNYHLAGQVRELLGHIKQIYTPLEAGIPCLIKVFHGKNSAECGALIPPATLKNLLRLGPWYPLRRPLPDNFPFTAPVCLGKTRLKLSQLRSLAQGDIVLATEPLFSTQGQGVIRLANLSVGVEFQPSDSTHSRFTVISLETLSMSETAIHEAAINKTDPDASDSPTGDPAIDRETDARPALSRQGTDPIDALPCNLTICGGNISITLAELRELEVGSVLLAEGEAPGYASLKKGNHLIARGELVDVDGRLGVQITSLEL